MKQKMQLILLFIVLNNLLFAQTKKEIKEFISYLKENIDERYLTICHSKNDIYIIKTEMPYHHYSRTGFRTFEGEPVAPVTYDTLANNYCFFIQISFKSKHYTDEKPATDRQKKADKEWKKNPKAMLDNRMFFKRETYSIILLDNLRESFSGRYQISDTEMIEKIDHAVLAINSYFEAPVEIKKWRLFKLKTSPGFIE